MLWDRDFEQATRELRFGRASVMENDYWEIHEQDGSSVAERRFGATADSRHEILRSFLALAEYQFQAFWGWVRRWQFGPGKMGQWSNQPKRLPSVQRFADDEICILYRPLMTIVVINSSFQLASLVNTNWLSKQAD